MRREAICRVFIDYNDMVDRLVNIPAIIARVIMCREDFYVSVNGHGIVHN